MAAPLDASHGLSVALEMEIRGINLYVRAQQLTSDPALLSLLRSLEAEEREHMKLFSNMLDSLRGGEMTLEQRMLSAARAADAFYPGGLMQMSMDGALNSAGALLREAAQAEKDSIAYYEKLAGSLTGATGEAVRGIIAEEKRHLLSLNNRQMNMEEEQA